MTGCTGCGFQQGACQGFSGCTGCGVQQGACQGFQQGCQGFQGCTGCGVQHGACLGTACSGQGCGMPCVSGQGQNLSQGLDQVGLERQGLTGCQGPNVGGVTPQNERMLHWRAYLYAARLDIRCRGLVLTSSKRNLRPPNVLP